MEFLETKSLYFSEYLSIWLRLVHQGLPSRWVSFLCHLSYRPANGLEAACSDPLQRCINTLTHFAHGAVDPINTRTMTEIFAFVVYSI